MVDLITFCLRSNLPDLKGIKTVPLSAHYGAHAASEPALISKGVQDR